MNDNIEFAPIRNVGGALIYSVRRKGETSHVFGKFIIQFTGSTDHFIADDFNRILTAIDEISKGHAHIRYFRYEGKMSDRVYALPIDTIRRNHQKHGTLRLYCIRVSDELLIIGGGGIKNKDSYDDIPELREQVEFLQAIDRELKKYEEEGLSLLDNIMNLTITLQS